MRNNLIKMRERLSFLRNSCENDGDSLINELRRRRFVSYSYDFRNLATDQWYLSNREYRNTHKLMEAYDCNDPIRAIWFRVIVMAIYDARSKRPCDLDAWKKDYPPGGIPTCTSTAHICAPDALGWLLGVDDVGENVAGLRSGTIRAIIGSKI